MTDNTAIKKEFKPECLTISLGKECNQKCLYCYAHDHAGNDGYLHNSQFLRAVAAAAELVAESCREKGLAFYSGFQGGGEPLLQFSLLKEICEIIKKTAARFSLPVFNFITSNGTVDQEKYSWLADNFKRICISVDGMPEMHAALRADISTFKKIRETINILKNRGNMPVCRVTATKIHGKKLFENIKYLVDEIGFRFVQVEPVYCTGAGHDLYPEPDLFTESYGRAGQYAHNKGAEIFYSGYRPREKHGTYCNIAKKVLFINRAGTASACLFQEPRNNESLFCIGHFSDATNTFMLDYEKIASLNERLSHLPGECSTCIIVEHCTKGCPDFCLLKGTGGIPGSIRCKINKKLHGIKVC